MLKVYNTLTRKKEEFKPLNKNKVNMYVCGPTVYNYIHLGNARSIVAFDIIRRYLIHLGFNVDYAMNFTDIDDKIINAANDGQNPLEVSERFIKEFKSDISQLNVLPATHNPQVSHYIPEIIKFIQKLLDAGKAYISDGDVYFKTRLFKDYGKLSHQQIDELEIGESQRMSAEEIARKSDPLDFVLWKGAEQTEFGFDAPFGFGRPGWHIECSVMSMDLLGETFDIHGGGQDLQFPHHENEIAQSESVTGRKFANYWMHNGFVTVGNDADKMSKSVGNFITVHDLLKTTEPNVIRLFLAQAQYRSPLVYTDETLTQAKTVYAGLKETDDNLTFKISHAVEGIASPEIIKMVTEIWQRIEQEMNDDFNTPNALTAIFDFQKRINVLANSESAAKESLSYLQQEFRRQLSLFGITFNKQRIADKAILELINERNEARSNKDFKRSDEIRDILKDLGVNLKDTPEGTRYSYDG